MNEFALIRRYFAEPSAGFASADVALGIGDDAALLIPTVGEQWAVSTDTLVEGRHFPVSTAAADVAWKALAVNVSDLAAMGARPCAFLLALTLPEVSNEWLGAFSAALAEASAQWRIPLVGGDTTRGPLSVTITVLGAVPQGRALRRDGAQPGDRVCVTGPLGDAALALQRYAVADLSQEHERSLRLRLDRPTPRIAEGQLLRDLAHAALDLSDGLAGDLPHLLRASGVGARIEVGRLPRSAAFDALVDEREALRLQLAGGDDYELCLCISEAALGRARGLGLQLHEIGEISAEPSLQWLDDEARPLAFGDHGFQHFS